MKKIWIYVLVGVLSFGIGVGVAFAVLNRPVVKESESSENDSTIKDNDQTNKVVEDKVVLKDIKKVGNNIVEEFEVNMNEKTQILEVSFEYNKVSYDDNVSYVYELTGKFRDINFYDFTFYKDVEFDVEAIKKRFNENNFSLIKGTDDKTYLGIVYLSDYDNKLYVFDDVLNNIVDLTENRDYVKDAFPITRACVIPADKDIKFYENTFDVNISLENSYNKYIFTKVEDNRIYNLALVDKSQPNSLDVWALETRVYTINNGKLEYVVKEKRDLSEVAQQCS